MVLPSEQLGTSWAEPMSFWQAPSVTSAVSYTHLDVYKRQIWDGEVEMTISNSNFYPTSIKSPLTVLRDSCSEFLNKTYFDKIRELDKLISEERVHKKNGTRIVELEKQKSVASEAAKEGLRKFRENFIRSNQNSFLSLYYLTESGFESGDIWHIEMFELLSDSLKNHSRAKIYK